MADVLTKDDLNDHLLEQLTWHWERALRPRLDGLSDAEYLWEPVPGSWNVRRRDPNRADQPGSGSSTIDFVVPEPVPPPVTTIAWRLAHVIVGIFGARVHSHFGGPPASYDEFAYAGTAEEALAQLDDAYERWKAAVERLTWDDLATPVGPAEGPFAALPMIDLVLHIHREAIHHGAEIALLRDLYAHR